MGTPLKNMRVGIGYRSLTLTARLVPGSETAARFVSELQNQDCQTPVLLGHARQDEREGAIRRRGCFAFLFANLPELRDQI
jgi:hypothetical protein